MLKEYFIRFFLFLGLIVGTSLVLTGFVWFAETMPIWATIGLIVVIASALCAATPKGWAPK